MSKSKQTKVIPSKSPIGKNVRIVFGEDQFYDNQKEPLFEAGKIYEISDSTRPGWIYRWMKRGGRIVEETQQQSSPEAVKAETGDEADGLL